MKRTVCLCVAGLVIATVTLAEDSPSYSAEPAKRLTGEGLIALSLRDSAGQLQVFTIRPNGSGRKQLTFTGQSGIPTWSRDGKRIAFMTIRDDHAWAAVMEADGSNQKLLAEGMAPD